MFLNTSSEKRGISWGWFFIVFWVLALASLYVKPHEDYSNPKVSATVAQIKGFAAALQSFRNEFRALPGDLPDASKHLVGCPGDSCNPFAESAGNEIIGNPDFIKSLKPQVKDKTRVPAASAEDETVLFWHHLLKANLIGGVTDDGIKNGSEIKFGTTLPQAKSGGGFIVGYADGTPLPTVLSPASTGLKGTIIVQISENILNGTAEPNTPDKQPLTPNNAAKIDRKMDDGRPLTGYVRAYGAPGCFSGEGNDVVYNETDSQKDCGLIYRIGN